MESVHQGKMLIEVIKEIESSSKVKFYFLEEWIRSLRIQTDPGGRTVQSILLELFENTDLSFFEINTQTIIFIKDPTKDLQHQELLTTARKEFKQPEKIGFGTIDQFKPGLKVKISGTVIDSKSREPVVGASIMIVDLNTGAVTNGQGDFELDIFSGTHVVNVSYVNYEEKVYDLTAFTGGRMKIELEETPVLLDEVVVIDRVNREVTTARIGQTKISIQDIKRLPALMGEVDLVKQIQATAGVTTAGEAASGFNVRGGSVDQNLILYDGVPLFNTAHAFGFFSAFNSNAIRDVNFYRGGIPAEFGGRASSVLDITSMEGNSEKWHVNGGVGLLSGHLQVNGPLKKNKTTVATSFRSTYSDWLINSIQTNYANLKESDVFFYDGSAKFTHHFSDKTKISASFYGSHDRFRLDGDSTYSWANRLVSLRLDKTFSSQLQATFSLGSGTYSYKVNNRDFSTGFDLFYKINYPTGKADFIFQGGPHKLSFGFQGTYYDFNPGSLVPTSYSNALNIQMEKNRSTEYAAYFGDGINVNEKFFVEAGLRYSWFASLGPGTVYTYQSGLPLETIYRTGEVSYNKDEVIKRYHGLEPRASARFSLSEKSSIKAGFNRVYQYLHLITNTTSVTPIDIWLPSGTYFKPQYADQLSLGYYLTRKEKKFEGFLEGFYKEMNNVVDFKDGALLILNKHIETDLLQGKGKSFGAEFSVTKNTGRLQGTASYTWSRSLRTINGPSEREKINKGNTYPSNFDQPHSISMQWRYGISRRIFFTGSFTFRTGRPISAPLSGYIIDHVAIGNFSERNQFRIPHYHRLDLGLVLEGGHKRNKIISGSWSLSVVNVYSRKNPYTVFFRGQSNGVFKAYKISVIGSIFPSLSYNFKI